MICTKWSCCCCWCSLFLFEEKFSAAKIIIKYGKRFGAQWSQEPMQSFARCIPPVCVHVDIIIHKKQIHLYILYRIFVLFWRDAFLVLPLLNLFLALFLRFLPRTHTHTRIRSLSFSRADSPSVHVWCVLLVRRLSGSFVFTVFICAIFCTSENARINRLYYVVWCNVCVFVCVCAWSNIQRL